MEAVIINSLKIALLAFCGLAAVRGGGPERMGAAILLATFIAKSFFDSLGISMNYQSVNPVHMTMSVIGFSMALALAVVSNRLWPLFFAALYLVQLTGHLAVLVVDHGESRAYWAMTQVPIIAQVAAMALGILGAASRRKSGIVTPDWRDRATI